MQTTLPLTQTDLTRQERLLVWLRRKGITQRAISVAIGVKDMSVNRWLYAERLPSWRVRQLVAFGIPEDLLPRAEDVACGRKPGWKQQVEAPTT